MAKTDDSDQTDSLGLTARDIRNGKHEPTDADREALKAANAEADQPLRPASEHE